MPANPQIPNKARRVNARGLILGALAGVLPSPLLAAPAPTEANVAYGDHPRQVLDFYRANGEGNRPLLFFVHGGGWMGGDKANPDFLERCLASGISVVSINYRHIPDAIAQKVEPPVSACLGDAARALQFVRSKAPDWGVDKTRIGGCGGSAGGCTVLWLAFHPDQADPSSADPVARESTRLRCALAFVPQTTLDPKQLQEWIPNNQYGNHAFSLPSMAEFVAQRERLMPWISKFSPYALVSPDDPPVLLFYDKPANFGQPSDDPPHSGNHGAGLAEKLVAMGVEHEINYNDRAPGLKYRDLFSFLQKKLLGE